VMSQGHPQPGGLIFSPKTAHARYRAVSATNSPTVSARLIVCGAKGPEKKCDNPKHQKGPKSPPEREAEPSQGAADFLGCGQRQKCVKWNLAT